MSGKDSHTCDIPFSKQSSAPRNGTTNRQDESQLERHHFEQAPQRMPVAAAVSGDE